MVIDALRARLTDPDNPVRRMAVESLGRLVDVGSFDAILQVLESADDPFSEASAVASLAANEPSLRPRARAAIRSWAKRRRSPSTDQNLALYLRLIGDDDD
jgi:HEAT repeat protein